MPTLMNFGFTRRSSPKPKRKQTRARKHFTTRLITDYQPTLERRRSDALWIYVRIIELLAGDEDNQNPDFQQITDESIATLDKRVLKPSRMRTNVLDIMREVPYIAKKSDDELLKTPFRTLFNIGEYREDGSEDYAYYEPGQGPRFVDHDKERDIPNAPWQKSVVDAWGQKLTAKTLSKVAQTIKLVQMPPRYVHFIDPITAEEPTPGELVVELKRGRERAYMLRESFDNYINHWHAQHQHYPVMPSPKIPQNGTKMVGAYAYQFMLASPPSSSSSSSSSSVPPEIIEIHDSDPEVIEVHDSSDEDTRHRKRKTRRR